MVLTRAVFAVLLPILFALIAVLTAAVVTLMLFAIHPALALPPLALLVAGIFLYARWEQQHHRPPEL